MDSLEKLNGLLYGANTLTPEDEEQARLLQALQVAGPFIGDFIPKTAEELDNLLLGLTRWAVQLRSDDAPDTPLLEVVDEALRERAAAATEVSE